MDFFQKEKSPLALVRRGMIAELEREGKVCVTSTLFDDDLYYALFTKFPGAIESFSGFAREWLRDMSVSPFRLVNGAAEILEACYALLWIRGLSQEHIPFHRDLLYVKTDSWGCYLEVDEGESRSILRKDDLFRYVSENLFHSVHDLLKPTIEDCKASSLEVAQKEFAAFLVHFFSLAKICSISVDDVLKARTTLFLTYGPLIESKDGRWCGIRLDKVEDGVAV